MDELAPQAIRPHFSSTRRSAHRGLSNGRAFRDAPNHRSIVILVSILLDASTTACRSKMNELSFGIRSCVYSLPRTISALCRGWVRPVVHSKSAVWRMERTRNVAMYSPSQVVQASSSEIFGAAAEIPQSETTRIASTSPYGGAKAFRHHAAIGFRGVAGYSCRR